METLKEWVLLVATCAVLAEICHMLMPEGKSRGIGMLAVGLVFVFVLMLPMENILKLLGKVDFSYELEQEQVVQQMQNYEEAEMLEVTKEYKGRLETYMCQLVNEVEGIADCEVSFVMEENYQIETYGMVQRIYVTAYKGNEKMENTEQSNSGFSQMNPIEKIEITWDGIVIVPSDSETTPQEEDVALQEEVSGVLQKAFCLEKTCVFVEVKDG